MPSLALLDANVLYPAPIRDLLLNLAMLGACQPKWTDQIQAEWIRNLLKNRPDLTISALQRTEKLMNKYFPDARITGFEYQIELLNLPDQDDRHVLAAAIYGSVDYLVTENIRDFPEVKLSQHGITAITADNFINKITEGKDEILLEAFKTQVRNLANPPMTEDGVLDKLAQVHVHLSSSRIKDLLSK